VVWKSSFIYDIFDISDFINDIAFSKPMKVRIAVSCDGCEGWFRVGSSLHLQRHLLQCHPELLMGLRVRPTDVFKVMAEWQE